VAITWDGAAWAQSTSYDVNQRVVNVGNAYVCRQAGTSAALGGGPTGTGTGIVDGTCLWDFLGAYTGSVLDVAPELATGSPVITRAAQITFLSLAERRVGDAALWLDILDDGRRYLAAHFGQLTRLRGHGPLTSESVGQLARGYAALMGPFAVDLTAAGRAYMDLVRTLPTVVGFTA
jgi:hypothetical protein